jgi:hypothetical protein
VRSYGIYLWHAPIIVLSTPADSRSVDLFRALAQVAASVGLAALSWRYIEEPVRHGALGRLRAQARSVGRHPLALPGRTRAGLSAATVGLVLACIGLAGISAPAPITSAMASISPQPDPVASYAAGSSRPAERHPVVRHRPARSRSGGASAPTATRPTRAAGTAGGSASGAAGASAAGASRLTSTRTACRSVVHIGDSTSEGMISSDYLPDPAQRLVEQYRRVGVRVVHLRITGGTSIVETLPGTVNAYDVARSLRSAGYQGCWVIALGTNDTADIYVGSSISLATRIRRMMSVIGDQPVMWVNAKTLVSSGPYAESNMQLFNQALVQACPRYPNMRVYDWASVAKNRWFIPDGIHYYSPGYAARSHLIADALAEAFPASGTASDGGCVVHTPSISLPVLGVKP